MPSLRHSHPPRPPRPAAIGALSARRRPSRIVLLVFAAALFAGAVEAARKDKRIEALPEAYRQWLESVELLISKEELEAFLTIEKDYQRDAFIERFWRIRDTYPDTARNEFKERWENLLREAMEIFGSLDEDRSRMLLMNGPPDGRLEFRCTTVTFPIEIWFYDGSDRVPYEFYLVFVQRHGLKRFVLWRPRDGLDDLLDRLGAGPVGFWDGLLGCQNGDAVARILRVMLADPMEFDLLEARIAQPTKSPSPEWVATFESYSTDLPEDASVFPAEVTIEFPGRYQSRTEVLGTVRVAPEAVAKSSLGGQETYNFLLAGEVLREGKLFENFRYKFDVPAEGVGEVIPMTFQRRLRDGPYQLVLRVEDLATGKFFREERSIDVPAMEDAAPRAPVDAESAEIFASAAKALESGATTLELITPRGEMHAGMVRFDTLTTGEDIAEVVFSLNGADVMRKRRPPWSVELDLGRVPRTHELRAVAYDGAGKELASDDLLINGGSHQFRVRLVEPRSDQTYTTRVRASAEVALPEEAVVERVEFYLDETRVATLFQPPFTQDIALPAPGAVAYVRAVAFQPDGNSTEDLVFINAPDYLEEVEVEFVELYTTVLDKAGRPVLDLRENDFSVLEDGVPQSVVRFELVSELPIHAGIVLDVSASMEPSIDRAKRAALQFFETAVTPKDRAALITFNDHPQLAAKFTNNVQDLAAGLAGIKAERGTALYDSLIFTLYYFNGIRGQRVVLLLSDGMDENSRFAYEDALEYARRTGVSIYAIGLKLAGKGAGAAKKALTGIAEETGGRSFFIDAVDELDAIYAAIQEEVRSRYLIGYQSSNTSGRKAFREVEVRLARPGLEAKTMRGYYP
ncbi:MAG TPA: VWA domain-containing protein [Thermoanaerobaculia bacterium]|nr:VWA domain-containing protein [Thermoanaerobaculia bacterium]